MSITYTPTTNFGAKDSLPANDPAKVIKGTEFTTEYTAIQSAFALAAPAASPTITGTATFDDVSITNGLTVDGTTLVVDDVNNRVGIGTSNPLANAVISNSGNGGFEFTPDAAYGGGVLEYINRVSSTTNPSLKLAVSAGGGGDIILNTGGSDRLTVDSSGSVGIGTDSPNRTLTVSSASGVPAELISSSTNSLLAFFDSSTGVRPSLGSAGSDLVANVNSLERMRIDSSGYTTIVDATNGDLRLGEVTGTPGLYSPDGNGMAFRSDNIGANPAFTFSNGTVERMRIDASGRVLIAHDAAIAGDSLEVTANSSGNGIGMFGRASDGISALLFHANGAATEYARVQAGNTSALSFHTGSSGIERMRIDASGNLLVGKTVANAGTTPGVEVNSSGVLYCSYSGTQPAAHFNRGSNGTGLKFTVGYIDAGGVTFTQNGTPSFVAASDERLKENITDHESELANVMALRPVRWDWKANDNSGEGFIAQEIQETAWADLVSEGDDGMLQVSGLGTVETRLIKAMQEQQAMIEELKAEVEALKNA